MSPFANVALLATDGSREAVRAARMVERIVHQVEEHIEEWRKRSPLIAKGTAYSREPQDVPKIRVWVL